MTGLVILAAGSSSRLGKPKQNLIFNGKTLLQQALDTAINSVCEPVVLVLGANADVIKPVIEEKQLNIIRNDLWEEGMASSIRAGLTKILKLDENIDSVIFMLCDQPFADEHLLNQLVEARKADKIICSFYNETFGVPALFDTKYFDELLSLKGKEGAKKLFKRYAENVMPIPFPSGIIDIDTIEDYERLIVNIPNSVLRYKCF